LVQVELLEEFNAKFVESKKLEKDKITHNQTGADLYKF
tara:strand:+ start:103 stop:216 length:114 start_codon:yes stop_codon:yes gene_type:complete